MPKQMLNAYPVLLAGGSGTRLWPVSRELFPKQLVRFFGNEPLIQHTVKRLFPILDANNIRVVCGSLHAHEIIRDIEASGVSTLGKIIDEPCGRNTAPAICLAVLEILKQDTDAIVFVFPADHVILDIPAFHKKIADAHELARQDWIVTFGITPNYPETGYGYIEASETRLDEGFAIKRFVEKPDFETAQMYIEAGNFYWNSGMFAFKAITMIQEFEAFHPRLLAQLRELVSGEIPLDLNNYSRVENISIDYAVMEKTKRGVVLPADFGWSDIGSWKSLYDFLPKDPEKNAVIAGDVIVQNTRNSLFMGQERLIAVNNLENIVVVETPDSVFVSDMESSRDVKSIVEQLKKEGRSEYQVHMTVYEPWGYCKILEKNSHWSIHRVVVYPGALMPGRKTKTSCLCWWVIQGTAELIMNKECITIRENRTVRIPEESTYALKNIGDSELCIVENRTSRLAKK